MAWLLPLPLAWFILYWGFINSLILCDPTAVTIQLCATIHSPQYSWQIGSFWSTDVPHLWNINEIGGNKKYEGRSKSSEPQSERRVITVYISEMRYYVHYLHFSNYCPHLCRHVYHNVSAVVRSGLLQGVGMSNWTLYFAHWGRLF